MNATIINLSSKTVSGARLDWAAKQSVADAITSFRPRLCETDLTRANSTTMRMLNAFEVFASRVADVEESDIGYRKK